MARTRWNERFLASTRGRIVGLLRRGSRTVNELADEVGLTDNAVRARRRPRVSIRSSSGDVPDMVAPHAATAIAHSKS